MSPPCLLRLACVSLLSLVCWARHEDEVGQYEWSLEQLGRPTALEYSTDPSNTKRVFVATASGAIAAVFIKDGSIEWRRLTAPQSGVKILRVSGRAMLSVSEGNLVQLWKTSSGALTWQQKYEGNVPDALVVSWGPQLVKQDLIILQEKSVEARALQGRGGAVGTVLWSIGEKEEADVVRYLAVVPQGESVCVLALTSSGGAVSLQVDLSGGKVLKKVKLPAAVGSHLKAGLPYSIVGSHVVFLDSKGSEVKVSSLVEDGSSDSQALKDFSKSGSKAELVQSWRNSPSAFAVTNKQTTGVFKVESGKIKLLHNFDGTAAIGPLYSAKEEDVLSKQIAVTTSSEKGTEVQLLDPISGSLSPVTTSDKHTSAGHGRSRFVVVREAHSGEKRAIVSTTDHSIAAIQSGNILWVREEALANIEQASFWARASASSAPKARSSQGADQLSILIEELIDQATKLPETISNLLQKPFQIAASAADGLLKVGKRTRTGTQRGLHGTVIAKLPGSSEELKGFGADKVIIATTKANKLFALEATTSEVVWQHFYGEVSPDCSATNSTLGFGQDLPLKGKIGGCEVWMRLIPSASAPNSQLLVVTRSAPESSELTLRWLEPSTGKTIHEEKAPGTKGIQQIAALPKSRQASSDAAIPCLLIDGAHRVHTVPSTASDSSSIASHVADRLFHYEVDTTAQAVHGHVMVQGSNGLQLSNLWNVELSSVDERIVAATTPQYREWDSVPVHIKGDASILYRYINPNLLVVVSESAAKGTEDGSLNLYAINSVTGHILHQSRIAGGKGPVHAVACDNWAMLHYWNSKKIRFEMYVVEFFEAKADDGPWNLVFGTQVPDKTTSAHHLESPIPLQQTYIFPAGVTAMGVTATQKGITPRSVLMALTTDHIFSVSKDLLNPRRPMVNPQGTVEDKSSLPKNIPAQFAATKDEGIAPYHPVVPFQPKDMLTYHLGLTNMRGIVSSPTSLESTSMVFAYGLDLFFTPVQTARAYDVLSPGFNYQLLYLSVTTVLAAVFITSYLASAKVLHDRWK